MPDEPTNRIDAHAHIGSLAIAFTPHGGSPAALIRMMDAVGVEMACVSATSSIASGDIDRGDSDLKAALHEFPGRFLPLVTYNPNRADHGLKELARRFEDLQAVGIKVHPHYYECDADSPLYEPGYGFANERGCLVLCHTELAFQSGHDRSRPSRLGNAAEKFQGAQFVMGHSGFSADGYREAILQTKRTPNIYLEVSPLTIFSGVTIDELVAEAGPDRVLYGSDAPLLDPRQTMGRILFSGLPQRDKDSILGGNAARLLSGLVSHQG